MNYSQFGALGWRVVASISNKFPQTAAGPDEDKSGSKAKIKSVCLAMHIS